MVKDLELFNELVEILLKEEQTQPVAQPLETHKLYQNLNLSLNDKALVDQNFKEILIEIIKKTPKTA